MEQKSFQRFVAAGGKPWKGILLFLMFAGVVLAGAAIAQTVPEVQQKLDGTASPEINIWTMKRWSPYVVGFLIGVLTWVSFLLSDKPIGVSTAYARSSGMLEEYFEGASVRDKPYYRQYVPKIDWEWMLVIGLVAGAFVSARTSGDFDFQWVPPLWESEFGHTPIYRWFAALLGGMIMGIGARWADGCTSGHGISGALQLVVSSWIALACFFIGGVVTAFMIY